MRLIRSLWRRLSLAQRILVVAGAVVVAFLFGGGPLVGSLPCADGARNPAGQAAGCIRSVRRDIDRVRAAFCGDGSCGSDVDDPPGDALDSLQTTLSALPLGWALPGLFAQPTRLVIPAGTSVDLVFDPEPGSTRVSVGRVVLIAGARLSLSSTLTIDRPAGSVVQTCTAILARPPSADIQAQTRLAVAAAARTQFTLGCALGAEACGVLLDNGSADLARNSQCERD